MKEIDGRAGRVTLRVAHDLLRAHVPTLCSDLRSHAGRGARELVLDLADVDVLDEAGLALLVAAHNTMQRQGGRLSLVHVSDDLRRFLEGMMLDEVLRIQEA